MTPLKRMKDPLYNERKTPLQRKKDPLKKKESGKKTTNGDRLMISAQD